VCAVKHDLEHVVPAVAERDADRGANEAHRDRRSGPREHWRDSVGLIEAPNQARVAPASNAARALRMPLPPPASVAHGRACSRVVVANWTCDAQRALEQRATQSKYNSNRLRTRSKLARPRSAKTRPRFRSVS